MPSPPGLDPAVAEQVAARLARAGQRWTHGRRHVVEALARARAPLSVQEVQEAVAGDVPLSSLYRIIGDLVEARVLIRLEFSEGFARYELDEELAAHHHHLVCTDCGSVTDLELPELERTIHDTAGQLRGRADFTATTHRLDFFGRCGSCQAKATR